MKASAWPMKPAIVIGGEAILSAHQSIEERNGKIGVEEKAA
jgi:hypothetical protein